MNTDTYPRRGRLYAGPKQFSEGWPLLRCPVGPHDSTPWVCPGVDTTLERWTDAQVVEPPVQGTSPAQRAFLDQCYSRNLDVTTFLSSEDLVIWEVHCENHRFGHPQHGHRFLRVYATPTGSLDQVQVCDPDQVDDALATVTVEEEDVAAWLDVIRQQVEG